MLKRLAVLTMALLLVCVVLSGLYLAFGRNQLKIYQVARELSSYPLPPGTQVLSRDQNVAYPVNSDWCTASASYEITTPLSEAEVRDYYGQFRYQGIENGPAPLVKTPDVVFLSSDGARNHFKIMLLQLYTCFN